MAPAHPHATGVAVYPALFYIHAGGSTDTGNNAWRFLKPKTALVLRRDFLSHLPEDTIDNILSVHKDLAIILRVASSQRKVDTAKLQKICGELYLRLVCDFSWINISTSVHILLAHASQLVTANEGFGLGTVSEQGSEGKLTFFFTSITKTIEILYFVARYFSALQAIVIKYAS